VKAGTRNSFLRFLRPPPVPPVRGHFVGFNRTVSYWVHLVPPHPCPLPWGEGIPSHLSMKYGLQGCSRPAILTFI
jgi:hypothetical protein